MEFSITNGVARLTLAEESEVPSDNPRLDTPATGAQSGSARASREQLLDDSLSRLQRHLKPAQSAEARRVRMAFAQNELRVFQQRVECYCTGFSPEKRERIRAYEATMMDNLVRELPGELNFDVQVDVPFFDKLIGLIGVIKDQYLSVYEHVLDVYTKFYAAFTDQITSKMSEYFEADKDGKKIKFNRDAFEQRLVSLLNSFSGSPSQLVPIPGAAPMGKEEARKWQLALGLPDKSLQQLGNGSWVVNLDNSPVLTIRNSLPSASKPPKPGKPHEIDTAKFNAWQSGFNAQEERLKNMLQSITSKYANANSYHDNFNKTLSAHLSQYADMLKHMSTW